MGFNVKGASSAAAADGDVAPFDAAVLFEAAAGEDWWPVLPAPLAEVVLEVCTSLAACAGPHEHVRSCRRGAGSDGSPVSDFLPRDAFHALRLAKCGPQKDGQADLHGCVLQTPGMLLAQQPGFNIF